MWRSEACDRKGEKKGAERWIYQSVTGLTGLAKKKEEVVEA